MSESDVRFPGRKHSWPLDIVLYRTFHESVVEHRKEKFSEATYKG